MTMCANSFTFKNVFAVSVLMLGLTACSADDQSADPNRLSGVVRLDGSSTVFPVSEAVAEEFLAVEPGVRVTVGVSGTGGGFQKFAAGEIDISDASRVIKDSEIEAAQANGIDFLEIPIAYDGLSVIVNKENTWVDYLTVAELNMIWEPGSSVDSWNDVRPEWPDQPLRLYGPGTDSGTFDYFTEVINGESGASRPDYTASEDDNVLVQGISGDVSALGFFGYAYYIANEAVLTLVPIDGGNGPVRPTSTTINDGSYSPLSRPIFIYLSKVSAARPEVRAFVEFYLDQAPALAAEVGYVAMPAAEYQQTRDALLAF
ncbi:MAG: phosphate ABC transporter substrate-binding protein [SAR86 cluster bacterium]|uniref:Phosphate-binding protein n=1 Tax=SAR86 cluster bacterium TaxID=2030880 RepID=A0A2A5CEB8_9GAMM|nr:PstS family phosphate ABC transporter substrate-binding protein [Gammaproteobacteria bacterium AH-315-E17]PCJ41851.1 MAG: phosphate ABC transporter substrate-binding protein [SAR86 cluster bacterium]